MTESSKRNGYYGYEKMKGCSGMGIGCGQWAVGLMTMGMEDEFKVQKHYHKPLPSSCEYLIWMVI